MLRPGKSLTEYLLTQSGLLLRGSCPLTKEQLAKSLLLLGLLHLLGELLRTNRGLSLRGAGALPIQLLRHLRDVLTHGLVLTKCLLSKSGLLGCLRSALTKKLLGDCGLLLCGCRTLTKQSLRYRLLLLCGSKTLTKSLLCEGCLLGGLRSPLTE